MVVVLLVVDKQRVHIKEEFDSLVKVRSKEVNLFSIMVKERRSSNREGLGRDRGRGRESGRGLGGSEHDPRVLW